MIGSSDGLILVSIMVAINCGYAVSAIRRPRVAGRAFVDTGRPAFEPRRAQRLLAFNLVFMAAVALFVAMRA